MCTAATYKTKDFYFGRTLDYEFSYGDEIAVHHETIMQSLEWHMWQVTILFTMML